MIATTTTSARSHGRSVLTEVRRTGRSHRQPRTKTATSAIETPAVVNTDGGQDLDKLRGAVTAYRAEDPDERVSWWKQGRCRGLGIDLFFPRRGESPGDAREVCAGCSVAWDCLVHALAIPEKFGIWGGTSERERRRLRRRLRLSKRSAAA